MTIQITFGKHIIIPRIKRSKRNSLAVLVLPNQKVLVKAPQDSSKEMIQKILHKKAAWIVKQQNYFSRFHPSQPPRKYQSGETHYYLGRQYRLKIEKSHDERISLKGKYFYVESQNNRQRNNIKRLLNTWYLEHAGKIFVDRLRVYWPLINLNGRDYPLVGVRILKKSWGSCSKNQRITLNLELVKASLYCIDYVLVHELCHLLHPRHDDKFYRLLRKVLPDWGSRKDKLEAVVI